jgi:hypothetical protein
LRLSARRIIAFQERVGFRYCAHKQQRLAVAAACYRRRDYPCHQVRSVIKEEAKEEHKVPHGVDRLLEGFPAWTATFVSSRPAGLHEVYDISVPGTHNFVANGITVHNCVYPTRTARFGTALVPWGTMQLKAKEYANDFTPIDDTCACNTCKSYTRAYLHLVAAKEPVGSQLLTHHNIAYQMRLMRELRTSIIEGRFTEYVQAFMLRQFPKKNYPDWAKDALKAVDIDLL